MSNSSRANVVCAVLIGAAFCWTPTVGRAWTGESWRSMTRDEIVARADQMVDSAWSPANTIYNYRSPSGGYTYFYASSTYYGEAYSQNNPQENWSEFKSLVDNTSGGTTGYGNDCSGFVSICWGMTTRHTTSTIEGSSHVILLGSDGQCDDVDLIVGDACNKNGSHIILFDYYSGSGGLMSMEQTPTTATRRYWSWSSLAAYRPIRRKDIVSGSTTPIVIDNHNSNNDTSRGYVSFVGDWACSSATPGYYATGYCYAATAEVSAPAEFYFYLDAPASRTVDAWWTAGSNRATSTPYMIVDSAGTTLSTVRMNQTVNGGQWNTLGTWSFPAGWNKVLLSRWTTSGDVVIADAVQAR